MIVLFVLLISTLAKCNPTRNIKYELPIHMPDAVSDAPDALFCHSQKLDEREAYILKYEPHATRHVAHHMMVFGCEKPGSDKPYWPCGEMFDGTDESVCDSAHREIIYAWANDGDGRGLPEGVGYRVGGRTKNKYIVIQMHYKDKFKDGQTDNSGVILHMTHTRQPHQAGYIVLATWGSIPPHRHEFHMESGCVYEEEEIVYPIAYRTHSHSLGVVTSGYRIRNGTWTEIGRMSPQQPQTFYDVSNPGMDLQKGDTMVSRCTMNSMSRSSVTKIGEKNSDEMCNFYIMYYTAKRENLKTQYCLRDPAVYHWKNHFNNIPTSASSLKGISGVTEGGGM